MFMELSRAVSSWACRAEIFSDGAVMLRTRWLCPLLVTVLAACRPAANGTDRCTQIWCDEGMRLVLVAEAWAPGPYEIVWRTEKNVTTCRGTLPLGSCGASNFTCDRPGIRIEESGCALPPEQHAIAAVRSRSIPRNVELTVRGPRGREAKWRTDIVAQCSHPNGPSCDLNQCCSATRRTRLQWREGGVR